MKDFERISDNNFKIIKHCTKHKKTFKFNEFQRKLNSVDLLRYMRMSNINFNLYDIELRLISLDNAVLRIYENLVYVDFKNMEHNNFDLDTKKFFETYNYFTNEIFNKEYIN